MVSIREILSLERFSNFKLINKNGNIDREVTSVDITETPDVKDYTSEHTILLTTAMNFKDDPKGLIKFIDGINEVPVAALGIKLSRFIHTLDQAVIDHADSLNFPLIEIPDNWKLGQATHSIATYISNDETEKLYYALEVQQRMNSMLIKEFSVERMLNQLSQFLRLPLMLINPFYKVEEVSNNFTNNQKLYKENLRYFNDIYLPEKKDASRDFNSKYAVFEVPAFSYFPYYLVVSNLDSISYPFSHLAIEQAINSLSFAIYKNSRIRATEQEDVNLLFGSIINSSDGSPINLESHPDFFERYHLKDSSYYQVIICGIDSTSDIENSEYVNERYQLTFEWLQSVLVTLDPNISIFGFGDSNKFAILLQDRHEYYQAYCRHLQQEYKKYFKESLSFGIGNEVSEFSQIHTSFLEAQETFDISKDHGEKEFLEIYRPRNFEELLQLLPADKVRPFVISTLGELAFPANTKDKELKKTLQIYMDNQCDITKTSNEIFVHRNTVKYRINKCEEMLRVNVMDPVHSLNIRLALFISQHIQNT
ncbi:MAG TPA: PucR family transcriptional regulator ligand-binding domain-containing protein [Candidatus Jeotgalicoccus stercoravium]|nr:PucR family transcriptional regulator ligand-binding domain-containing protein [Candidatus Jeotgalicoccus stercoravium]